MADVPARSVGRTLSFERARIGQLLFFAGLLAMGVLPLLFSLPFINEPLGRDQATYFSVVESGSLPYDDVFDHKPPLIYVWYAFAAFLNGGEPSLAIANVLAALSLSGAALSTALAGYLLGGRKLAMFAGILMALFATNRYLQFDANTEVFMLPPLVLSMCCAIYGCQTGRTRWFALAGLLCGIAAMTKTVALFNAIAIPAALTWAALNHQLAWSAMLRWSIALVAGAAAVVAASALPFIIAGLGHDFWYSNVTYNIVYTNQVSIFTKMYGFLQIDGRVLLGALPIWVLAAIGLVLACRSFPDVPIAILLASTAAAFLGAVSTGRNHPHYFVELVPFAALFAGIALGEITRGGVLRNRLHVELFLLILVAPTLLALLPVYVLDPSRAYEITHEKKEAERANDDPKVAHYVASITQPDDRIYVMGRETQVYSLSDRKPAAYYSHSGSFEVDEDGFDETMDALATDPPAVIIDTSITDDSEVDQGGFHGHIDDLTSEQRREFDAFLAARYGPGRKVEHAIVYERLD